MGTGSIYGPSDSEVVESCLSPIFPAPAHRRCRGIVSLILGAHEWRWAPPRARFDRLGKGPLRGPVGLTTNPLDNTPTATMRSFFTRLLCVSLLLVLASPVFAASGRELVEEGNTLYRNGKYEEALKRYDGASVDHPKSAVIHYNKANALYEKGNYEDALALYEDAADEAKDTVLEGKAVYNMGNCTVKEAMRHRDSDLEKTLNGLKRGIGLYRKALDFTPDSAEAKENIEVVVLRIKMILDQLKNQAEQEKQQGEKRKELEKELKELAEKQKELREKTEQSQKQQEQGENVDQQSQQQKSEQKQLEQETKKASQKARESAPDVQQELSDATQAQSDAADALDKKQLARAAKQEKKAEEKLNEAIGKLEAKDEQRQQQQQDPKAEPQDPEEGEPQKQEEKEPPRDETAQQILAQERENEKKRRKARRAAKVVGVEKPW